MTEVEARPHNKNIAACGAGRWSNRLQNRYQLPFAHQIKYNGANNAWSHIAD